MDKKTMIKICGLTKPFEAEHLILNKVDYAGMVLFFPKSKRNISIDCATKIIKELGDNINKVAVTVSPTLDEVQQIEKAGFDYIQIHGELSEEILVETSIPIWKAFNVSDMSEFQQYRENDRIVAYVFDAAKPGSGQTFDWKLMDCIPRDHKPIFLAGGLTPENVGEAISYLKPEGVDVSSSVEYTDRQEKDGEKIDAFVQSVREADLLL